MNCVSGDGPAASSSSSCFMKPTDAAGAHSLERRKVICVLRAADDRAHAVGAEGAQAKRPCRRSASPDLRVLPSAAECLGRLETDDCVYLVCKREVVLGRETEHSPADVGFADSFVSRQHLQLRLGVDGRWRLKCNSKNGVCINDAPYGRDACADLLLPAECVLGFPSTSVKVHFSTLLSKYAPFCDDALPSSAQCSPCVHPEDPEVSGQQQTQPGAVYGSDACDDVDGLDADFEDSFDGGSKDGKPPYSYATLIVQAIASSADKQMTLNGIYGYITKRYAYYRLGDKGWQNSIRHNLSLNRNFIRVPRSQEEPGKGSFWRIAASCQERLIADAFKERRRGKTCAALTSVPSDAAMPAATTATHLAVGSTSSGDFSSASPSPFSPCMTDAPTATASAVPTRNFCSSPAPLAGPSAASEQLPCPRASAETNVYNNVCLPPPFGCIRPPAIKVEPQLIDSAPVVVPPPLPPPQPALLFADPPHATLRLPTVQLCYADQAPFFAAPPPAASQLVQLHARRCLARLGERASESAPASPSQLVDRNRNSLDDTSGIDCAGRVQHHSGGGGGVKPQRHSEDGRQRLRICYSPPEIRWVPTSDTSALKHMTSGLGGSSGVRRKTAADAERGGTKSLCTTPVKELAVAGATRLSAAAAPTRSSDSPACAPKRAKAACAAAKSPVVSKSAPPPVRYVCSPAACQPSRGGGGELPWSVVDRSAAAGLNVDVVAAVARTWSQQADLAAYNGHLLSAAAAAAPAVFLQSLLGQRLPPPSLLAGAQHPQLLGALYEAALGCTLPPAVPSAAASFVDQQLLRGLAAAASRDDAAGASGSRR